MTSFKQLAYTLFLLTIGLLAHAQTIVSPAAPVTPSTRAETPIDRASLKYSNKWRLRFENTTKSDGTLVFRVTEKDADPVIVRIAIKKGMREGNVCDVVKSNLRKALPRNFKVEGDDGDHVLVKHNFTEGRFSLELLSNDVKKMKVKLSKE